MKLAIARMVAALIAATLCITPYAAQAKTGSETKTTQAKKAKPHKTAATKKKKSAKKSERTGTKVAKKNDKAAKKAKTPKSGKQT